MRPGGSGRRPPSAASRLTVPGRGRWFVYAELERGAELVEAWRPIKVGEGSVRVRSSRRYAYVAADDPGGAGLKLVAGFVLYALMPALLTR